MTAISNAVATVDSSPAAMVKSYSTDLATVMPTHIKPETWVRLAVGALKRGKKDRETGRTDLETAFLNDPGVGMAALMDAARLGLEPGTEQYYLTPRRVKGKLEILGIVGYQGYIELMYRAGAISSVVAECVYQDDRFEFQPGRDERPQHVIDWDAEDRGPLRLAYAYAVMKDGATSKVVVLNRAAIKKIKASSQGASSEYSPWQTHEPAMWLKSAVRQLAKWIPTSAEYRREQLRAAMEASQMSAAPILHQVDPDPLDFDPDTGEIHDAEIVPAEDEPVQEALA